MLKMECKAKGVGKKLTVDCNTSTCFYLVCVVLPHLDQAVIVKGNRNQENLWRYKMIVWAKLHRIKTNFKKKNLKIGTHIIWV